MTYDVAALGTYIRYQRESWGWSQDEFARRTGLKQRKISRIETGEIADPGFMDIAQIALCFGVGLNTIARVAGLIEDNP